MKSQSLPPAESMMDLLQEVRQFRRDLQRNARELAGERGQASYAQTLKSLVDQALGASDPYMRIVCYASAAELGIPVDLDAEPCRLAFTGRAGQPLRVLFWAAHRRIHAVRQARWRGVRQAPFPLAA